MKTITIKLKDNGGFELKGLEDIESRSECIWLMLAVRMLETRTLEIGYLPELMEGLEERIGKSKDKIQLLTKEEQEGNPVSPTHLSIELPKNVPSNIKPIVILPRIGCERVTIKAAQYEKGFTEFETTLDLTQSHIINLNTGVE